MKTGETRDNAPIGGTWETWLHRSPLAHRPPPCRGRPNRRRRSPSQTPSLPDVLLGLAVAKVRLFRCSDFLRLAFIILSVQNVPTIPPAKRRKIMPPRESPMTGLQSCVTECSERPGMAATPSILSAHTMRRSSRMTFSELEEWEKFLSCKEQECKTRTQQLDERLQSLIDREDEAATQLSQVAKREAQNALSQLEEHFTCALYVNKVFHALTVADSSFNKVL